MYDKRSQENRKVWSILNSLSDQIWDQTFCLCFGRGSLIAMFMIKEAAMGSVARRGSNDQ